MITPSVCALSNVLVSPGTFSVTDLILFKIKGTSEYFLLALEVLQHIILLHWKLPIRYEYHFVIVFLFQFLDFDMWLLITVTCPDIEVCSVIFTEYNIYH